VLQTPSYGFNTSGNEKRYLFENIRRPTCDGSLKLKRNVVARFKVSQIDVSVTFSAALMEWLIIKRNLHQKGGKGYKSQFYKEEILNQRKGWIKLKNNYFTLSTTFIA